MLVTSACCHPVKEMLLEDANTVDDLVDSYFTITVSTVNAPIDEQSWFQRFWPVMGDVRVRYLYIICEASKAICNHAVRMRQP